MSRSPSVKLAIGPVTYFWTRAKLIDFYQQIATSPAEIIYLGETVCAKRREMRLPDWLGLAKNLAAAGKDVVLSTLGLIESRADLRELERVCEQQDFCIEANDVAAVQARSGADFIAGAGLNIYNPRSLSLLAGLGMQRCVLPYELSAGAVQALIEASKIAIEILAFGRIPLAHSARCFSARNRQRSKDDCGFCCADFADGELLKTQEQEEFLVINGTQVQSALSINLISDVWTLQQMGVSVLRLNPQSENMAQIIAAFDAARTQSDDIRDIDELLPVAACNGYWQASAGMKYIPK